MKQINLGQVLTLLANVGVLIGLAFVAYEIRQSNRIAVGTTAYELNRNWMEMNQLYLKDTDVLDLVVLLADEDFVSEDVRQPAQVEAYARRLLNNWTAIEEAYENGIASKTYYSVGADEVRAVLKKRPGLVPVFERITTEYDLSSYEILDPLFTEVREWRERHPESHLAN